MDWQKVWIVARHEYGTNVRRAGFIIMTAIVPVIGVVGLVLIGLFGGLAGQVGAALEDQFDLGGQLIGVVDGSGYFSPILPAYQDSFVLYDRQEDAEAALEAGEVSSVMVFADDYLETGRIVLLTTGSGFGAAIVGDSATVRAFLIDQLLADRVDAPLRARAADPSHVEARMLSTGSEGGGGSAGGLLLTFFVPYFLAVFLVMTIFVSSGYLLQGLAEEKENRVIEIIVSSARPIEIMAGKVTGLGALGLTQVLVWLASAWGFSGGTAAIQAMGGVTVFPVRMLVLSVLYYVLGYALYAILMASVGVLGTTMRESQQLAGIFSVFAMVPYMLSGFLFASPNTTLARALSYFPLTAPTMMMMRLPVADVPWIDVVVSTVVLLLSIPAALWLGARLFEVGLLVYGKRPTLREILRILRSGHRPISPQDV